jgi:hypothetical protein
LRVTANSCVVTNSAARAWRINERERECCALGLWCEKGTKYLKNGVYKNE